MQGRGESGADAARAHDADREAGGAVPRVEGLLGDCCIHAAVAFRSSPRGVPDDFSACYASVSSWLLAVHSLWEKSGRGRDPRPG
ncbi:hypothetical protein GCM10010207_40210 [Streptomyces atratus]|nr:hypothetical protein GCM10010207_40210 [Streptomyces atratus]